MVAFGAIDYDEAPLPFRSDGGAIVAPKLARAAVGTRILVHPIFGAEPRNPPEPSFSMK